MLECCITVYHKKIPNSVRSSVMLTGTSMVLCFLDFASFKTFCEVSCTKELIGLWWMNREFGVLYCVFVTSNVLRFATNLRIGRIISILKLRKSDRNLRLGKRVNGEVLSIRKKMLIIILCCLITWVFNFFRVDNIMPQILTQRFFQKMYNFPASYQYYDCCNISAKRTVFDVWCVLASGFYARLRLYSENCQTFKMELSTVNYFRKRLHLGYAVGFWIRL